MTRRALDKYRTPDWMTRALMETYPEIAGECLIDPCAGDGRMARMLSVRFAHAATNDIDAEESTDTHADATKSEYWDSLNGLMSRCIYRQRDLWLVTNPPFKLASKIAWHAVQRIGKIALLLRATWLEPTRDRLWLGKCPPDGMLVMPRPSFTGGGSDSVTCNWMLWGVRDRGIKVHVTTPGQLSLADVA